MANYISREEAYQRWGEPRIRDYATHSSQRKSRQRPAPTATTEQIDASLDNAIARTTDVINSYIGGIVKLPLASTNTPPILKTIALYLVLSEVRVGVDEDENSEPLRWRREGIRLLEKINKGEIKIGVLPDGTELAEDGPCIGVAGAAANQLTSPHSEFGEAYQSSFDGREPVEDGFISEGTTTFINQGGNANIEDLSITTAKLANNAVTIDKLNTLTEGANGNVLARINNALDWITPTQAAIGVGSVDTVNIADDAITSAKIGDGQVTQNKLGSLSASVITTGTLNIGRVPDLDASKIVSGQFNPERLADGGVDGQFLRRTAMGARWETITTGGAQIDPGTITDVELADDAVIPRKILDGAVGTTKISDGAVTSSKIAANAVGGNQIASNAISTNELDRLAVTSDKLASSAVTSDKIASDAVTQAKIANSAVGSDQIAAGAVTETKISNGAVTNTKIADDAVDISKIADRSINIDKLDTPLRNVINANTAKRSYPQEDETKLDGIETGATADQTGDEIVAKLVTLTGSNRLPASAVRDLPSGGGGGTTWKGDYANNTAYAVGDRVVYNGEIYVCVVAVPASNTTVPSATNNSWIHLSNEGGYQTAAELVTALEGLSQSSKLDYNSALRNTPTELPPPNGSVTNSKIANNAVTNAKMADNSVGTSELVNGSVNDSKISDVAATKLTGTLDIARIADASITGTKIADNAITGTKIAGSTITSANLANNSVTAAQIAAGAVDSSELADEAVTTGKLGTGAVTNAKIANGTISGLKILGETITAGHLDTATTGTQGQIIARDTGASGGIAWIDAPSGGGSEPADGSITSAKLAANAVTKAKVADDAIGTDELDTATAGTDGQYLTKSGSQFAYVDAPSGGGGGSVVLSDWAAGTSYAQNEAVIHNGEVFVAKSAITPTLANTTPDMDSEHWEVVNEWNSIDTYTTGQAVLRNGTVYRALNDISATQTDSEFGSIGPTGGSQYASNANYRGDGSVVFGHSGGTQSFPPRSDDNTNVYTIQISGNSTESRNGIVQGSYDYITDNSTTVRCRVGSASQMQAQFGTEDFSTGGGSIVLREYTPNTAPESDSTNWQSITSSAWSGSATYAENDVVTNGTPAVYYRSKFAIASPANTSPNMSNAFWDLVGGNVSVPAWVSGTIYTVGTRVTDDGATWECLSAVRSTQKPIRERSVWRKVSTEIIRQLLVQSVNRFDNIFPYSYSGNGRIVEDYDWIEFRVLYSTNQGTFIDHPVVVPAASWAGNTSFSFSGGQLISSGASSLRRGSIYRLNSQNTSSLRRTGFQLSGDVGFSAVYGIR